MLRYVTAVFMQAVSPKKIQYCVTHDHLLIICYALKQAESCPDHASFTITTPTAGVFYARFKRVRHAGDMLYPTIME